VGNILLYSPKFDDFMIFKMLSKIALAITVSVTYLGAFSRFTHGRYTPAFYAYQLDRAPDVESTMIVPYIDATLGTLLLFKETRVVASLVCVVFQGLGVILRFKDGKSPLPDICLCSIAMGTFLSSAL